MFVVVGGGAMVVVVVLGYGLLWWCDLLGVYAVFDVVVVFFLFFLVLKFSINFY